jgi:hypothetical protein
LTGTQIEAAVPKSIEKTILDDKAYTYKDYTPLPPSYYVNKTIEWADKFNSSLVNKRQR